MVRATHTKTKMVYIAFIILYFTTIEKLYCGAEAAEGRVLKTITIKANNEHPEPEDSPIIEDGNLCYKDIISDLDSYSSANICAIRFILRIKNFKTFKPFTKKYIQILYRNVVIDNNFFISPNEDCETQNIGPSIDCINSKIQLGFWHTSYYRTAEQVFFGSRDEVKLKEDYLARVEKVRMTFYNIINARDWTDTIAPAGFCSSKCKDQISAIYNDCKTFNSCRLFAYLYLRKADLESYALNYMEYIYEHTNVRDDPILMTPESYCFLIADELKTLTGVDMTQWISRIMACQNNMVEFGIDLSLLKQRYYSILTEFENLRTRNFNILNEMNTTFVDEVEPNDDTNGGYFKHIFYNISFTSVDRLSDAYKYAQRLLDVTDFNDIDNSKDPQNGTRYDPDQFCNHQDLEEGSLI